MSLNEVDWSWAMKQAAFMACNNMNVLQYLLAVYNGVEDLTPVYICAAHIIHSLCQHISSDDDTEDKLLLMQFLDFHAKSCLLLL